MGGAGIMSCEGGTLAQGYAPETERLNSDRLLGPKYGHRASGNKARKSPIWSQLPFQETEAERSRTFPKSF